MSDKLELGKEFSRISRVSQTVAVTCVHPPSSSRSIFDVVDCCHRHLTILRIRLLEADPLKAPLPFFYIVY
jgi:hypothetical protein